MAARYIDRRTSIRKQLAEVDELVLLAEEQVDLVVRAHLQRLAVIQLSGFVEKSVEHILNGYLEENSAHRVLRFGQRQVARLPNMNPEKLTTLVRAFDDEWAEGLEAYLAVDERRQNLGNLIGARHALAHGGSTVVNGAKLRTYHEVADGVIKYLLERFLPLP